MLYIVPKNFKKGSLIAGRYTLVDVIILVSTFAFSTIAFLVLMTLEAPLVLVAIAIIPALVGYLLTSPFNNWHNWLHMLLSELAFISVQKKYSWEGIARDDIEES